MMVAMLLSSGALAENLYAADIQFAEFTFGMNFGAVRAQSWVETVDFSKYVRPTRLIGDALSEVYTIAAEELSGAAHFSARLPEREVAGHCGQVHMYFTYPGNSREMDEAVFYAGSYMFYENALNVFDDLKTKLASLYGTPWMEATDADEIWGPLPFADEWLGNEWNQLKERYQPTNYVVWKSSANGAMLVLKSMRMYGDMDVTEVCYLWPEADQYFDAMVKDAGVGDNNVQGL